MNRWITSRVKSLTSSIWRKEASEEIRNQAFPSAKTPPSDSTFSPQTAAADHLGLQRLARVRPSVWNTSPKGASGSVSLMRTKCSGRMGTNSTVTAVDFGHLGHDGERERTAVIYPDDRLVFP